MLGRLESRQVRAAVLAQRLAVAIGAGPEHDECRDPLHLDMGGAVIGQARALELLAGAFQDASAVRRALRSASKPTMVSWALLR